MIKPATVQEIKEKRITKAHGRIVVVTRYFPRYLQRKLIHDYMPGLAPSKELLSLFKSTETDLGNHDAAFEACEYESKFEIGEDGFELLKTLSIEGQSEEVYFVCHCLKDQYCHRELVMLLAEAHFGAPIGRLSHDYSVFRKRIEGGLISKD